MMTSECAGSETGRRVFACICAHVCVCVCVAVGGGQWGEGNQGEDVTVASWTTVREQYVGQGLALANLSWLEPWLGVLNFCMHDQWHWIKKRGERQRRGGRDKQVRTMWKDTGRMRQKKEKSGVNSLLIRIVKEVHFCKWFLSVVRSCEATRKWGGQFKRQKCQAQLWQTNFRGLSISLSEL